MNRILSMMVGAAVIGLSAPAFAQIEGNPPTVDVIRWEVRHAESADGNPVYGVPIVVYDRDAAIGSLAAIRDFRHLEKDLVEVEIDVSDPDWIEEITVDPATGQEQNGNEPVFLRMRAFGLLAFSPPSPTPIPVQPEGWFPREGEGFRPIPGPTRPYHFFYVFNFRLPDFIGQNQRKLTGELDFDVAYDIEFCATNENNADQDNTQIGCGFQEIHVSENSAFRPPNPQSFADAGPDRTVATGTTVRLDASRTFDATNIGFNPGAPSVIEKDNLVFAWEWNSGPVRVDPVQSDPSDAIAEVELTALGEYVFRVTVDDGSSTSLPSFDTVTITVLESLPVNNEPTAVIVGPANAVQVGQVIQLDGRDSFDPNGDELVYRWRQINEIGDPITGPDLLKAFQPLSGVNSSVSTWQAINPGTYYFRLLVDDGEFLVNTTFTVRVIDSTVSGRTATADQDSANTESTQSGSGVDLTSTVGVCGAGAGLLGFAPLAMLLMRRRYA